MEVKKSAKEKIISEIRELIIIFIYLSLFFLTFLFYRKLVLSEVGVHYSEFGFAFLKAFIVAKVILLARLLKITRIFDSKPLIVPTIYKTFIFALFMLLFEFVEHLIVGQFKGQNIAEAVMEIFSVGASEFYARTLVLFSAFIPFFAFTELERVLEPGAMAKYFFKSQK